MAPALENSYCGLLTNEENLQIFKLLGNRCQTLCTTVVQLYLTKPPDHTQWFKKTTGVLCFVKDNTKKNFFFRLFCTQRNMKIWEHEMYNNMEYIDATPFFHYFEGENCHVAFNFANVEDARDLRIVVHQKIHARKKREEKRCKQISQSHTLPPPKTNADIMNYKKTLDPSAQQAKRRRNITKADIGIPRDFKHISHVGWDSTHGFDVDTEDEQLKAFFKKAGVSEQQLQDKSTREYIYDFINRNGGREAIEQTNRSSEIISPPPAVPPRAPSGSRPPHLRNAPPPPIPNKNTNNNVTPRKPRMDVPPPKKPAPTPNVGTPPVPTAPSVPDPPPRPPPILEETSSSKGAPPVPAAPSVPAPPPLQPPPMLEETSSSKGAPPVPAAPSVPAPPPPPPPPPMLEEISSSKGTSSEGLTPPQPPLGPLPTGPNAALLENIRNGTTLKSVEERKIPLPAQDDARSDLLSEIRKGCKLKSVDERNIKPNSVLIKGDDLASALARALSKRSEFIHSEDDDDKSDSSSTASDWDD